MPNTSIHLLLIDDDADDRELFAFALDDLPYPVTLSTASGGCQGIEMLKAGLNPDFVFLDLNMPQMNGRECIRELKANPQTRSVKVVIFSTSNDPSDIKHTKELGALHFITKPSSTTELTSLINAFLQQQVPHLAKPQHEKRSH